MHIFIVSLGGLLAFVAMFWILLGKTSQKVGGCGLLLLALGVPIAIMTFFAIVAEPFKQSPRKTPSTIEGTYSPSYTPTQSAPEPSNTASSETRGSFTAWTKWSDGRTWNSAPESDKRDLCTRLASVSTRGNSANFYYDALQELYNTTDPKILAVSLEDSTKLIEAGSSALSPKMRKY